MVQMRSAVQYDSDLRYSHSLRFGWNYSQQMCRIAIACHQNAAGLLGQEGYDSLNDCAELMLHKHAM